MKRSIAIVGVAFAVALAVVIGTQMSTDAMAVVVGVVCGVSASIPTSLLLIWALGRRGQTMEREAEGQGGRGTNYPPVVVVNPGPGYSLQGYRSPPALPPDRSLPAPGSPRTFKVVGDEETMLDELQHIFRGLTED